MTDIPNDKKLSERFAEAIDGVTFHGSAADYETLGALSYRNSKDLLDALRLSESRPSAINAAIGRVKG